LSDSSNRLKRDANIPHLAQESVAFEIRFEAAERLEAARYLLVQRRDIGRQQTVKVERLALGLGERRASLNRASASNSYPLSVIVAKAVVVPDMSSPLHRRMPDSIVFSLCELSMRSTRQLY
jgi:hypothetical protein